MALNPIDSTFNSRTVAEPSLDTDAAPNLEFSTHIRTPENTKEHSKEFFQLEELPTEIQVSVVKHLVKSGRFDNPKKVATALGNFSQTNRASYNLVKHTPSLSREATALRNLADAKRDLAAGVSASQAIANNNVTDKSDINSLHEEEQDQSNVRFLNDMQQEMETHLEIQRQNQRAQEAEDMVRQLIRDLGI